MLYVFLVDTGTMLALDMNLALETVSKLKETIESVCAIPADKQVLLISGGESLNPDILVGSYSAGTDTNPIYLFSKGTIESPAPPSVRADASTVDSDLRAQVEASLALPSTFMTVVSRSQFAQQFHDIARDQNRACEQLVHEQHLQQQGWAAVVANLEDITSTFKERVEVFNQKFVSYLGSRDSYIKLLDDFASDLALLGRIPVLRSLLESEKSDAEENGPPVMLRDWIASKDCHNRLETVAEQCSRGLELFDARVREALQAEVQEMMLKVNNPSMKEVKGLEDRLYGLDQLISEARKMVREQGELAQAFLQNQIRAGNLGDASVIPDLCASHQKQLMVMLDNHRHLCDIHQRCVRAKGELSANLHTRLRWIMFVEGCMSELDNTLGIVHENLKRLRRHLDVAQQIHLAPILYLSAVTEVARRRIFSEKFLKWSKDLARRAESMHAIEVTIRRQFMDQFGDHFLRALFPGLGDFPPPYASKEPEPFDTQLPNIRPCDVQALREVLPEFSYLLDIPEAAMMPELQMSPAEKEAADERTKLSGDDRMSSDLVKSSDVPNERCADEGGGGECLAEESGKPKAEETAAASSPDDRDPEESEPDTEEFETLEGGPADVVPFQEQDVSKSQLQLSTLKAQLQLLRTLGREAAAQLRREVAETRDAVLHHKDDFASHLFLLETRLCTAIDATWQALNSKMEQETNERLAAAERVHCEALSRVAQQLEVESHKLGDACTEIRNYQDQIRASNEVIDDLRVEMTTRLEDLRRQLTGEHQEVVKSMTLEHELELESLKEEHKKQLEDLACQLQDAQAEIAANERQLQQLEESLTERFRKENELVHARYEEEYLTRESQSVSRALEEAEVNFRLCEDRVHQEADRRVFQACEELRRELQGDLERERVRLTDELQKEFDLKKEQMLREARELLAKEHKQEIDGLRARFRLAFSTAHGMERSPSESSLEKIGRVEDSARLEARSSSKSELDDRTVAIDELRQVHQRQLEELHGSHRKEIEELRQHLEKDNKQSLKAMKVSMTAERQVLFNEAVQHATCEKENVIQELRLKLAHLQEELEHNRCLMLGAHTGAEAEARGSSFSLASYQSEGSPSKSQPDSGNFQMVSPTMARRIESSWPLNASVIVSPISEQTSTDTSVDAKESEINTLEASTSTTVDEPVKVSVFTCDIGDLVLLYYDDRHENYLVFAISNTSHFVSHDCLAALNLVPGQGEPRKSWTLAYVTDKEYCQARKQQNRFRVPCGAKFYRVRAEPWSQEAMLRQSQMPLSSGRKKKMSVSKRSSVN